MIGQYYGLLLLFLLTCLIWLFVIATFYQDVLPPRSYKLARHWLDRYPYHAFAFLLALSHTAFVLAFLREMFQ
jgi:hypothetical protein